MAITHIHFNDGLPHGRLLRSALSSLERGHDDLNAIIASIQTMIDGDGTDAAHFDEVVTRFAFPSTAVAKAAWGELNSLRFKLNTNESVSDVLAAIQQAMSRFR